MKRMFFIVFSLLLVFVIFARVGENPTVVGRIISIETKDQLTIAKVEVKEIPPDEIPLKVKGGMSVRIIYSIETAQFRLPIGNVLSIEKDGTILVSINPKLLEKDVQNPKTQEYFKVKELFSVGAEVSISNEAI